MSPRNTVLFAALVLWCIGGQRAEAKQEQQSWDKEFVVVGRPTVRIETHDARVVIRSWKESRVTARVEMQARTEGLFIGSRRPVVDFSQEGKEVRIRARVHGATTGIMFSSIKLEVEVWLPRESDLIVQSSDGAVSAEDIEGRIDIETQDGSLTARALKGDIAVHTSDGRVELDDIDGSLRLETRDGRSDIRGRFDRIDVQSQDGEIEADILPGSRIGEDGWSLRSQDGGIHLRIPRALTATLDVRTRDGGLSVDLPMRIQGGQVRRHDLVADLNGGGKTLRLRSSDGSIHVAAID